MKPFRFSQALGRRLRADPAGELGRPTRELLEAAVRTRHQSEAKRWLEYYLLERENMRGGNSGLNWALVDYCVGRGVAWEELVKSSIAPWLGTTAGVNSEAAPDLQVEGPRAILKVEGLHWAFHFTLGNQTIDLSLGSPEDQETRWTEWLSAMGAAIRSGKTEQLNELLDTREAEERLIHDVMMDWAWALLSVIGRTWGEATIGEALRLAMDPIFQARSQLYKDTGIDNLLALTMEGMRAHVFSPDTASITLEDEGNRYVMTFDACGTGGRMRRGDPLVGSPSRLEPPYDFLALQGSYDWTWNRAGVCAYCAHCAVVGQILPIESLGYPMRQVIYPEKPSDPCRWVVYKQPGDYPDEAFSDVGKTRNSA